MGTSLTNTQKENMIDSVHTNKLWQYTVLALIYGMFQLLERKILNIYLIRSNSWNK